MGGFCEMIGSMPFKARSFVVIGKDRKALQQWLRCPTMSQQWALRARIVLAGGRGEGVRATARRLEVIPATVCRWRSRYAQGGLAALKTKERLGRPRRISDAKERAVVARTLSEPEATTHWSCRSLAKRVGLSSTTVHRIWQKYDLQPHRTTTFKFSKDPAFEQKLTDIVGLYLNPPEKALVLCVDEKSQIQALNRTQPILPLRPGLPARMTHDYKRNGTTSLFAALEVASGKVLGRCYPQHTHAQFVEFLETVHRRYRRREVHLICDNYGTHKHPVVREWLAAHPRFQVHFTPTSASWLNLVERWFALVTSQAIRRGSFDSVRSLERAINRYLAHWNENARPFCWTKSARQIRRQINRVIDTYATGH
jgi:transposase